MKNVLLLICAFALFATGFVSAAHADGDMQGSDQQIESSMDQDNMNDNAADPLNDQHCGHGHIDFTDHAKTNLSDSKSKLFATLSEAPLPSLIFGLKRPPWI